MNRRLVERVNRLLSVEKGTVMKDHGGKSPCASSIRTPKIEMAKDFTYHLVQDHLDKKDITKKVSMCKWYNAELANYVAYHCVQLHGGYGYKDEYQICRDALDVRMGSIAAGTTEVMKMIIARLMGL